jgi:hypothetical protein
MEMKMKPIAKASLIAVLLGLGATGVAAQTYAPRPTGLDEMSGNVVQIVHKKYRQDHRRWSYSNKYGARYRHRRDGYSYYRDGWWYRRPYWEPGVSIHLGL